MQDYQTIQAKIDRINAMPLADELTIQQAIATILNSYPATKPHNPKGYVSLAIRILCEWKQVVVMEAVEEIIRNCRIIPSIAEINITCREMNKKYSEELERAEKELKDLKEQKREEKEQAERKANAERARAFSEFIAKKGYNSIYEAFNGGEYLDLQKEFNEGYDEAR